MPISVRCVQLSESLSRWVPGSMEPLFSHHQGGGEEQQASGVREEAAGRAAPRRGAGAAPGRCAWSQAGCQPLQRAAPGAKQVEAGVGLAQGHMG